MWNMIGYPVTNSRSERKDQEDEVVNEGVVEKGKYENLEGEKWGKRRRYWERIHTWKTTW